MRTNAQAIEVINEILLEELNEIRQNITFMKKELQLS